jgi:TonB-linked SusC/RagA family outer membrane protein
MRKILVLFMVFCGISLSAMAQQRTVSGTVTGAEDKQPVIGCTVQIKGTTNGTTTDVNGKYTLVLPQNASMLVFSYIGMKKQEIEIANRSVIDVGLAADVKGLDEVVVTAFGISKEKKALGYAVQDVKNEVIERTGNTDLSGAMQGKIAGIDIKPSSGMPGASSQITIRGARSFTGNNNPLYVIDGMPVSSGSDIQSGAGGDFSVAGDGVTGSDISNRATDINPADIESINVLKGQAAAALYGIRASNGVIVITTKSGRGNAIGKPVISISNTTSFSEVSRRPDYQSTYAQGLYGNFVPNSSGSWGPKIADLPKDQVYGGDANGHPGKYNVPQLALAGLDPWVTPQVFNNWDDFFKTGISETNNINVSQAVESGNFALGFSQTSQTGIVQSTGMNRWNAKANAERKLNKNFTAGLNANFSKTDIDKLPSGNDTPIAGAIAAPRSYDLKDYPYFLPGDPYTEIYYRATTYYDNPYWAVKHYHFNEKTDRFFGKGYVDYKASLNESMNIKVHYHLGIDSYTTHFQDVFDYGRNGGTGMLDNYGISSSTVNSLLTLNYDWKIRSDLNFNAMIGNEFNQGNYKTYSEHGEDFNFGGWSHIRNANIVTANESIFEDRTVGFFGSLSLDWKSMFFFSATGRNDIVSTMPTNNRTFFYPSVSLSVLPSEMDFIKNAGWISFAKLRLSYAEVGQAGSYVKNYFTTPNYGGGWWTGSPIQYPMGGISSYISNNVQYDPNLKPQNTRSYEVGGTLKFFHNRIGIDYTFSRQNVIDQIFSVPLAASSGAYAMVMNGGKVHTLSHEVIIDIAPVAENNFRWDLNFNFSKIDNYVDALAPGVENIFLGGYVTPQVRAGIGEKYPVIYGVSFVRDTKGNIVVEDDPGSTYYGMPKIGGNAVIGSVSPDFILGATNTFTYKGWSLSATAEWKKGGKMYSGTNGLLDFYGLSKKTENRDATFIFDGVKPDGSKNDIARGGPSDPRALQDLYQNVLGNIDEYSVRDNSFVKLRELSLRYKPSKKLFHSVDLGVSVFARNILIWTALSNFDPESSQGNTNMGGSFEQWSLPQTTSYGFSLDITF